ILDTGTTTAAVADAMRERRFTVTPLSLHAAHTLAQMAGISLLMPGGYVRAGELSVYGDRAERAFADLRYDTFIVGCCGIDPVYGATAHDLEDVRVKRAAIRAARRRIVVATAEKLGKVAFGRICTINDIDTIVTDAPDTSE